MTGQLVLPVDGGFRMRVNMGDTVGRVLAMSGVWEPYVVAALARELSPGDVVADVGAHIGYHTLVASRLVGPSGHVYALEPSPTTYRNLCANLQLNAVSNVTALRIAAGGSDGYGSLVAPEPDNTGRTAIQIGEGGRDESAASAGAPIRALGSVLGSDHVERLRLVKIDVEGFEADVLRGVEALFAAGARASVIVELHPGAARDAAPVLERIALSSGLDMYELARNPYLNRFAPVPPPRLLGGADEMLALCTGGTTNILLTCQRAAATSVAPS